ncbi:hypothetical protein JXJ21_07400 [candidate division KSB1 bacterium]|nr:hypothetical protein [candidate division KSB1 bacterium]
MNTKRPIIQLLCYLITLILTPISFTQEQKELLLTFPRQWQFDLPRQAIILTSDQQLLDLQDPDKKINLSLTFETRYGSLREIREQAKTRGCHTVILAFDNFFRQYRKDAGDERTLLPDSDEYIERIQTISNFLEEYGLGLELSLLSPLELGPAFTKFSNGESGRWLHFKSDLRDPETGQFSVMLWEQLAWSNNKGKFRLERSDLRAFAFKGKEFAGGSCFAVDPKEIIEITSGVNIETFPGTESPESSGFRARRIRVYHDGSGKVKGYDRVFVLLSYISPEMDYFSPNAPLFLTHLLDKYKASGINLNALYSDEMHIQQDWHYFNHHDNGQFSLRYVTKHLANEYARRFGTQYVDFDKYMLYFICGPRPYLQTTSAGKNCQFVMGASPSDIHNTFLFRDRYYKLLNTQVVDLFVSAKMYAEKLYGKDLLSRAHATWAQSPTIDHWDAGGENSNRYKYEYTPNFIWSNTVHQAASACYDYFKWGEFLTGNGTDHPEGGWSDRNYYGSAIASSLGILNRYPNAYTGYWGMPEPVRERIGAIVSAYGASASHTIKAITENVHRDVEVLLLYPMSLVACDERFGSWMVQYGYANYITAEKLLELAELDESGAIRIADRKFTTLVTLFEPLPKAGLLDFMQTMLSKGGTVLWSGPPPLMDSNQASCLEQWQQLFGVTFQPSVYFGNIAAGKTITFENKLAPVPRQTILTDFTVDRIYPVTPSPGTEIMARVNNSVVGTLKGNACFLGFRPRDDQSASLGEEQRSLFEILFALNAYPPTGIFPGVNDNTEALSRTTPYLCTRFPNGTTIITRHYRTHAESWPGGFARNTEEDRKIIEQNPLPNDSIHLQQFKINGHEVTFEGRLILAFNVDETGQLIAFEGHDCDGIKINGTHYKFAKEKQDYIAWTPVSKNRQLPNQAFFQIFREGTDDLSIPLKTNRKHIKAYLEGTSPGSKGEAIPIAFSNSRLNLSADFRTGRWLYVTGDGS